MLYFDRIDVSQRIDVDKTSKSKEFNICCCWYFHKKGLSFNKMSAMDAMIYFNDVYEP